MSFVNRLFHLSLSNSARRVFWVLPAVLLFVHLSLEQIFSSELMEIQVRSARTRTRAESLLKDWTVRNRVHVKNLPLPYQEIETVTYERDGVVLDVSYDSQKRVVSKIGGEWTH